MHRARIAVRNTLTPVIGDRDGSTPRDRQCPDILDVFSRHLEGDIDPAACAEMEAHLARCGRCRGNCESLKRALVLCRQHPAPEMPAAVTASIKSAIQTFLKQS